MDRLWITNQYRMLSCSPLLQHGHSPISGSSPITPRCAHINNTFLIFRSSSPIQYTLYVFIYNICINIYYMNIHIHIYIYVCVYPDVPILNFISKPNPYILPPLIHGNDPILPISSLDTQKRPNPSYFLPRYTKNYKAVHSSPPLVITC